jgi:hypothetical protein
MNTRLPQLARYPDPWTGKAAKESTWRALTLANAESTEAQAWTRIEVSLPTMIYPFRHDGLTGGVAAGAVLEHLQVTYAPENPLRSPGHTETEGGALAPALRAFPSLAGGACYLWSPGEWWVRVQEGGLGLFGRGLIPFQFMPLPDPAWIEPFAFGRSSSRPPVLTTFSIAVAATAQVLSVQEALDGLRALQLSGLNTGLRFRWRRSTGGALILPAAGIVTFAGETLPLADAYVTNTTAAIQTLGVAAYF